MSIQLGYACINLSLQSIRGGPRLRSITAKRLAPLPPTERRSLLYAVARNNLQTLAAVLKWNSQHHIRLFRISSDLIPLATHPVAAGWCWQEDLAPELSTVGRVIKDTGTRVSMHPGQYTVLNAQNPAVVKAAVSDLVYHAEVLNLLGTGPEAGIVLHIGGAYNDRSESARRFVQNVGVLPPGVASRLWLENDDVTWDTETVLEVALATCRPMVLDIHHHRVLRDDPWPNWLQRVLPTWRAVQPKLHFSSPKDGIRSRSHADYIDPKDFSAVLHDLAGVDVDIMLECKAKDLALLRLRRDLLEMDRVGATEQGRHTMDIYL